jgi:hypothetical protein
LGLTKHAIREKGGVTDLTSLAAATAHKESTLWAGLEWLEAKGLIDVQVEEDGRLHLNRRGGTEKPEFPKVEEKFKFLLEETIAFRRHYRQADKDNLIQNWEQPESGLNQNRGRLDSHRTILHQKQGGND